MMKVGKWYAASEKEGPIVITKNKTLNVMLFKKIVDDKYIFDTYVINQDRFFIDDLWFKYEFGPDRTNIVEIDPTILYKRKMLGAILEGRIGEDFKVK